jgi:uncharacterized protein YukE
VGEQISKECAQIAEDYKRAIESGIPSWEGDAAEAYRAKATEIAEQIQSLAAAVGVSQAVQGFGQLVATVRGITRDLIADVVGEILIAAGAALASSWFTLGGSLAAFTGWAVARGGHRGQDRGQDLQAPHEARHDPEQVQSAARGRPAARQAGSQVR